MAEPAKVDILIDIKARLDEIQKATEAMRGVKEAASGAGRESEGFFAQFREGLGIGAGMLTVAKSVEIVKATIKETIGEAVRMASEIKDGAANLQIDTSAYQALRILVKETGGDFASLTGALNANQRALIEASNNAVGPAAAAYQKLGLSVVKLQGLPQERQFEAIARAIANAADKQEAFRAATVLLGERHVPRLRAALQELGEKGYDAVKEKADAAIMSPMAIATLTAATDAWKRAKDIFVAKVGEDVAGLLNLVGVKGTPAEVPQKSGDELRAAKELADQQQTLADARADLSRAEINSGKVANDVTLTEAERVAGLDRQYDRIIDKLGIMLELRKKMPLDVTKGETQAQRDEEVRKLDAQLTEAQNAARKNLGFGPTDYATRQNQRATAEANMTPTEVAVTRARSINTNKNPDAISSGDGLMAGMANWSNSVGTVGEQIASTMQGTIAGSISTVSDGIVGLITKTRSLGDVGRSMGMLFLQTLIQLGVQLVAQHVLTWALTAAHITGEGAKTAATIAGATARTAAITTEATATAGATGIAAVFRSIMELGPIAGPLVFVAGIAAMIALISSLTKREGGGPVKAGQPYIVGEKRPEMFVPDQDGNIVPSVDRYNVSVGNRSRGASSFGGASSPGNAQEARPTRYIHVMARDFVSARAMSRDADFDNVMLDWARRNRGEILV